MVRMVFRTRRVPKNTAEMNTYFPEWKAFWAAENICGTIHNIYTLRGALVRDALEWSKKIGGAMYLLWPGSRGDVFLPTAGRAGATVAFRR